MVFSRSSSNSISAATRWRLALTPLLCFLTFWNDGLQVTSSFSCFHSISLTRLRAAELVVQRPTNFALFACKRDEDDTAKTKKPIFALPPARSSSTSSDNSSSDGNNRNNKNNEASFGFIASGKFELQYTCKICDARNSNKISRRAYREGVVIAVCQGCTTKHWIADNLGWSKFSGGFNNGETNIEEFLGARGETVSRVSKDVWELENLYYTTESQSRDEENLQ